LQSILERFLQALSCIDPGFLPDGTWERLPEPSTVGKASVGGIDFHKQGMRRVAEAVLALSWRPGGFPCSELADQGARSHRQPEGPYGRRPAAYEVKKLRGKQMVERIGQTRPYQATPAGPSCSAAESHPPRAGAAQQLRRSRRPQNPTARDRPYEIVRIGIAGVFRELGVAA
jgi:hypothetical protein